MCGICGIFNAGSKEPVSKGVIKRMCSVLVHRGPDEEGVYLSGDAAVGLGVRRLSVIAPETGSQPISDESGRITVASNGEIYNFRELKSDLSRRGHKFSTGSDAEVIVHLYQDLGAGMLERLRGAYAFALLDENAGTLLLARDRVGKRPLYYAFSEGRLVFASEIKSVLEAPGIKREVNRRAVHDYLTYRYVPYPETAFKNIYKLPPAGCLVLKDGKINIERYWELDFSEKNDDLTPEKCRARVRELFEESVKLRLVSDAPLGAFLSGGLDSSILVGVMSGLMEEPVKTFSVGFGEEKFSELEYARLVSKTFNTRHREFIVRPDIKNILPKLAWHYDEPYADSSAVATYCLAESAAREVKVALNGDGGDESFAGYPRHKAAEMLRLLDCLPEKLKKLLARTGRFIPEKNANYRKAGAFLSSLAEDFPTGHARCLALFDNAMKDALYSKEFRELVKNRNSYDFLTGLHRLSSASGCLDRMMAVDILSYLPCDLLVKADVAAMANSLETRSPFLDHKFMEFAARIPPELKLKGFFGGKHILKEAYADMLPPRILNRHKMGFGVPVSGWLRGELKEMFLDTVLSEKALGRGYFNREFLTEITSAHMSGRADHGHRLWALLMLELWHEVFIDPDGKN